MRKFASAEEARQYQQKRLDEYGAARPDVGPDSSALFPPVGPDLLSFTIQAGRRQWTNQLSAVVALVETRSTPI